MPRIDASNFQLTLSGSTKTKQIQVTKFFFQAILKIDTLKQKIYFTKKLVNNILWHP